MKKLLTSLCILTLALVCVAVQPTKTEAAVWYGYEYAVVDGEAIIARYTGVSEEITIPYALGGYYVTAIEDYAFYQCDNITSVTIPSSIKTIGKYAFMACDNLEQVTIGKGVTTIEDGAFYYCRKLAQVTIGNRVISIGKSAFSNCESLLSVTIPDSVTTIGDGAFSFCSSLMSVTVPSTTTNFGNSVFSSCYSLESVTIPGGVTTIPSYTFYGCQVLKSVTIPVSVTSIDYAAFYDCRVWNVYYEGSADQWSQISIGSGNGTLTDAKFLFDHTHDYTTIPPVTEQPTCISVGYTCYTCTCGAYYNADIVNYTDHDYNAATCDSPKTCKLCRETEGSALGHDYAERTCTRPYTCKICGAMVGWSLGHSYDEGKVTKKSTCKATGVLTFTCKTCGEKKVHAISRLTTHSYKTTTTAKATLSKNGKAVKKCTVCGKVASTTTIKRVKTVKLSATSYVYNGKAKTPTVTVKDSAGKTLKKGTDYTVTYASGRKNVGTYKVTIKFKGNYSGTKTLTFKILPKAASINKLTAKSKAITVKLNRVTTQSTGYQIQYSTSSKFTSAKTVNIASYKTSSKTISGLKKGKKYYVRVRTYKTVGSTKFYSAWSTAKSVKTK